MRTVVVVIISALTLSGNACLAASGETSDDGQQSDELVAHDRLHRQMFSGINLTEHQRKQMRDLMRQAMYQEPSKNVSDIETMYRLVIADKFDEYAARAQAEKIAQAQVARQIKMVQICNQMYWLLTPEQQTVFNTRHERRIQQLREVSELHRSSPAQLLSSSNQ